MMIEFIYWCAGLIIGSYITCRILAFKTRKKRPAIEKTLREITRHQRGTGKHNDAVVITRIAMRGLNGG